MEPPPLTVSKRRDPLRDGVVFPAVAQDSPGPLQLVRPSPLPQAGPASGGLPSSSLLRTAAEAAAINRSMEAQQIRRQWDALVGASPLPQAFRHGLSPASVGRPALGGYPSPAVRAPPLYHMSVPSAHGPGLAAGYGSVAPSAIYRSTVQQRQQEQRQQQQQQQQQQQVAGLEVEASKYTHVLHSHSPGYQAVVSSTVQVVRQSGPAQPLPPAPRHPLGSGGGSGEVSIEELPVGVGASQQQEQRPSAAHPQPVMVLNVPLLPSPAAAPQQQQQQQQQQRLSPQQVAAALAAVPLGRGAMPSAAGPQQLGAGPTMLGAGPTMPGAEAGQSGLPGGMPVAPSRCQPSQQAELGGRQAQQTAEADLADAGRLVHQHGDAGELGGPPHSPAAALGDEAHSMEAALAQVGAIVRDLQTPVPDDEAEAGAGEAQRSQQHQQVGPASSAAAAPGGNRAEGAGQLPGAEQGDMEQEMPLDEHPQQQQQQHAAALDGPPEQPALAAQAQPAPAHKEQWRESKGERRPRRTSAVRAGTALPAAAPDVGGDLVGTAAAGAVGPVAQQEQEMQQGPLAPLAAADSGATDLASQQQASSSKAKERQQPGSKGVKKRVKAEVASSKRRTMLLRADAAKVEPLHRALGGDAAPGGNGIETTRSGRHRIKPLPFWASSRLVLNSNKDVVGIEQREDLLGISHQPRQQQKRGPAAKQEPSKLAGGGAGAKPPRPAGKGTAQVKGAGSEKQHPGKASGPQKKQQQQQQAEQSRRGRQREAKAKPKAQREQEGPAEVEAALQLQQLGRGEDAAEPPAMPIVQQPRAAAAPGPPRAEVGALGLAALAASAGAQAATAAAPQRAAGRSTGATAKRGPRSSAAAAAAAATVEGGTGKRGGTPADEALPAVQGVPLQVMRDLAQVPDPQRRKKCGHCKHCLQPSLKQACLALRALRNWEGEQQQEGAAPAAAAVLPAGEAGGSKQPNGSNHEPPQQAQPAQTQHAKRGKRMQQPEAAPPTAAAAAGKAKGKKRAAAAEQQAPSPKRARGRPRQQQDAEQAEESPLPDPHPEAAGGEEQQEGEEADEQGWTASQAAALQRAWLQIDPTASNFWQLVAKQVPGKTATECYNRHMARHPTPPHPTRKAAPRKYLAAAQEGARLPDIKPGASKQVMQNAARKYTRQLQWQQKASKAQEAGEGGGLSSELVEEMEAAERKDRYIDQILRKRQGRPLGMAARGRKPAGVSWPPAAASQEPAQPGVQAGGQRAGQAVGCEQEVRAALAGLQAHQSEEDRDSQEDSDYYWSDA